MRKKLCFIDNSLDDFRAFTYEMRTEMGYQLDRMQQGYEPDDGKLFTTAGTGVHEILIKDEVGTYRALYVAKFEQTVYVLHCFRKKLQAASQPDVQLAKKRYRELIQEHKDENRNV